MIHNLRHISPLGFQFSEFLRGTEEELCYCALILCKNILQLFLWRSRYLKSPIIRKNILWKKPMNSFSTILFTYRKIKWYFESQNWQKMHFQKQVSKVAIGPKVPSIVIFYEKIHLWKYFIVITPQQIPERDNASKVLKLVLPFKKYIFCG